MAGGATRSASVSIGVRRGTARISKRARDVCCVMRRTLCLAAALCLSVLGLSILGCGGATTGARTHRDPTAGPVLSGSASGRAMSDLGASPGMTAPSMGAPGAGPHWSFDGMAGGPISAMDQDASCRGWIPATPQIVFNLATTTALVVSATSGVDTTMVLVAPDGSIFCNDDTNGLDPQVSGTFGPGSYRVFIGTYSEGNSGSFHAEVGPG
jgi:hypothetical protein